MDHLRPAIALSAVALVLATIGLGPAVAGPGVSSTVAQTTPSPVPSGEGAGVAGQDAADGVVSHDTTTDDASAGGQSSGAEGDNAAATSAAGDRNAQQQPAPSPTPTPSATPSPTPSATPSPDPSGGAGGRAELTVSTRASRLLSQVGDQVTYTVSVALEGEGPRDVTVVTEVPAELDIAAVPLDPRADAIQQGRHGDAEDIVWILKDVRPGEDIDLRWTGRVVTAGDLRATATVEARAESETASASADTFLAGKPEVAARGTTTEPPVVKRKVIRFVPVDDSGTVAGAILPVTGWTPGPLVGAAGAAIALGLMLLVIAGLRKPNAALLVVVALAIAACTQTADDDTAAPQPDTSAPVAEPTPDEDEDEGKPRDRVKGTQITRGDGDDDGTAADPGTDGDVTDTAAPETNAPVRFERVVVTITEPGEVREQETRAGDNLMSFTWNEPGREIEVATSSIRFTDQPSVLTSSLSSDADGLVSTVTLENTSSQTLAVNGVLTLDVMQAGAIVAELRSAPIDVMIEPGGHATADFRYLLPSGDFSLMSGFEASS